MLDLPCILENQLVGCELNFFVFEIFKLMINLYISNIIHILAMLEYDSHKMQEKVSLMNNRENWDFYTNR